LFKADDYTINLRVLTSSDAIIRNVKKNKKSRQKRRLSLFLTNELRIDI